MKNRTAYFFAIVLAIAFSQSFTAFAEEIDRWERAGFSVNYGDQWRSRGRWRSFDRIVGSILITMEDPSKESQLSATLTNANGALEGYSAGLETLDVIAGYFSPVARRT